MIVKKSDDAVSPVIGVMLMLVVTVVIGAAVTIFATGVVGETEVAPVAALDVKILSSEEALEGLYGPELFITHLSGDSIDTKDIELRFSWTHDGCSHYSAYSADGMVKEHQNGISSNMGMRKQALYVKSTMTPEKTEYGSFGLNHYFGDVILTPGLKLTASSDLLSGYKNTQSQFMEMVFNNYDDSIVQGTAESENYNGMIVGESGANHRRTGKCPICYPAADTNGDGNTKSSEWNAYCNNPENWDKCEALKLSKTCQSCGHTIDKCAGANNPNNCACYTYTAETPSSGIMDHLPAGTAVDVMIIHLPSNKAIYDKTVIVQ